MVKKVGSMVGGGPRGSNIAPDRISAKQQRNSPPHSFKKGTSKGGQNASPVRKFSKGHRSEY